MAAFDRILSGITEIPVRTLEDWEAGRRTPPEYIPRLIEYQLKYEKLVNNFSDDFNPYADIMIYGRIS